MPQGAGSSPAGRRALAVRCGLTELLAPYQPGQAIDQRCRSGEPQHPVPDFRRRGAGATHRRFRPLSASPRASSRSARLQPPAGLTTPVRPAAGGRSRNRSAGAERQPRGAVSRGAAPRRATSAAARGQRRRS
ncbi:MAG: hypothetical protein MZV49_15245 [Rhodopseudomonas palustris]|nr:hypothetical protein [Rhodopseudomonas palustris]